MNKPVLGVDADDVFWAFNAVYVPYHNRMHGTTFTLNDIYTFDMPKMYGLPLDIILDTVRRLVHEEHHTIEPYEDAVETFTQLSAVFDLQIITSRAETTRLITTAAFEEHAPGLFSAYHFTNGFSQAGAHVKRTKGEVCREIGAVALLEDAPGNAFDVAQTGTHVYMPRRQWNTLEHHPELDHFLITPYTHLNELPDLLGMT
jgi:hypothetical protein